jgi:hypothetical protein
LQEDEGWALILRELMGPLQGEEHFNICHDREHLTANPKRNTFFHPFSNPTFVTERYPVAREEIGEGRMWSDKVKEQTTSSFYSMIESLCHTHAGGKRKTWIPHETEVLM